MFSPENCNHNYPKHKVTSSGPKPKDISFSIIFDKEKHQILTSEKLESANV